MISEKAEDLIIKFGSSLYYIEELNEDNTHKVKDQLDNCDKAQKDLEAYVAAIEAENAALKNKTHWIPVSEQLPADDVYVLILEDGRGIYFACYKEKIPQWEDIDGFFWYGDMLQNITHWMPLPGAPEES